MRKTELERFRSLLQSEKDRLQRSLAKHSKIIHHEGQESGGETAKAHSNHMADQGSDEFQYETTIRFASTEGHSLYEIDQALLRIENNTFGKCQGCGKSIALPRLRVLPYAVLCIECQEKEEKEAF